MTDATPTTITTRRRPLAASIALAVVSAVVAASLLCLGIAALAHAAGASPEMLALTPGVFVFFIVVGVVAGAVGWSVIRAKARNPRRLLTVLVPVVLAISLVPDVWLGVTRSLPGTSWTGVIALMAMHLAVAACAVTAFRLLLPVATRDGRRH